MKTLPLKSMLLAVALLFGSGVAIAEGTDKFTELDANQDGSLSQEEVSGVEGLEFESADSDGNGSLSQEEFKTAQKDWKGEGMKGEGSAEGMEGEKTY
ncbi:EF-hand domain-containing protein [Halomonas urmiana]|uniref:EF-hand domain-containing protein n=1 Tax=Halomonas urmiana TaxID=490901 RepID=A0A5R8MCJ4_9GAMM|nr:EF-hand domain-containing protein [Halomonas urmiana]TLF47292.1 EF-hand domain-containing protein [Halomonas urmiana]